MTHQVDKARHLWSVIERGTASGDFVTIIEAVQAAREDGLVLSLRLAHKVCREWIDEGCVTTAGCGSQGMHLLRAIRSPFGSDGTATVCAAALPAASSEASTPSGDRVDGHAPLGPGDQLTLTSLLGFAPDRRTVHVELQAPDGRAVRADLHL